MADDEPGRNAATDLFARRVCGQHCGTVSDNRGHPGGKPIGAGRRRLGSHFSPGQAQALCAENAVDLREGGCSPQNPPNL